MEGTRCLARADGGDDGCICRALLRQAPLGAADYTKGADVAAGYLLWRSGRRRRLRGIYQQGCRDEMIAIRKKLEVIMSVLRTNLPLSGTASEAEPRLGSQTLGDEFPP